METFPWTHFIGNPKSEKTDSFSLTLYNTISFFQLMEVSESSKYCPKYFLSKPSNRLVNMILFLEKNDIKKLIPKLIMLPSTYIRCSICRNVETIRWHRIVLMFRWIRHLTYIDFKMITKTFFKKCLTFFKYTNQNKQN